MNCHLALARRAILGVASVMIARCLLLSGLVLLAPGTWPALAAGQPKLATPEQIEFFEKRIRPLLVHHCYSCHSREAKKVKAELYLDTRAGVLKGGSSGPALVPGQPDQSLLIKAVRYNQDLRMPPKGKLSAAEIADLEAWVRMGAPDPRTETASGGRQPSRIDIAEGRKFWSFQPLQVVPPPAVKDASWPLTPIDRFILAKLEQKGLKPVALADRRTLLRRVTYDLIGLPPTPEEIEAFLKDNSPEAFARVVDRLLASPHYGERWGRHWLDVVRYADTAGDNSDYPIPQMYLYRNWVIEAFHKDMPYDRFVQEQLAGDLLATLPQSSSTGGEGESPGLAARHAGRDLDPLGKGGEGDSRAGPPATLEQDRRNKIIATGYLANSRRHGSYEDARYPWYLTIEDTIDNLGKTFLGLTINCTRCHDHKFDPLTIEDYYGLYGFFSSTRYPWPGIELDKMQRDLVPLVPQAEVDRLMRQRQQKLAELEAAVKKLEAERAALEKAKKPTADIVKSIAAAKQERDQFLKSPLPYETAYAVIDGQNEPKKRIGQVGNARVQLKGDPERLGQEVPRRFPLVLGGQTLPPDVKGSGRLELARWITDPANPLTARVMVNRIWHYHFGRGIVATPNNFGKQGRPPTHPELLDWLARQFIDGGWSIKKMHRLIVLSRVYQLSSQDDETNLKLDADNDWLWRYPRRRLDAEAIRDTLLAVSGNLDRTPGGPHPFPAPTTWNFTQHKPFKAVYETNRRSVYLMTQRIQRHPFLALFDGPDTNASTATRTTTTTPLQALFLMNDPFVHEQARKLAERLLQERSDEAERIERAFLLLFGRWPTSGEMEQIRSYLEQVGQRLQAVGVTGERQRLRTWESLARVLFMSNELVYLN